jgi:integrase
VPSRKRPQADLTGIRQRGNRFQVRVFGGTDPATGRQLILTGSAATQAEAIALRDGFRKQIETQTSVRTNVTLRVLLAEWLDSHQVEPSTRTAYRTLIDRFIAPALGDQTLPALAKQGPRPYEKFYAELRSAGADATAGPSWSIARHRPTSATSGARPTSAGRWPRPRSGNATRS